MNNPARRVVSAVQKSLLGDLVGRLFFLVVWLQWLVIGDTSRAHIQAYATTFACVLVFIVLTWEIGFVSIHEKPRGRWLLERIQDAPRNGFEVWTRTPPGGPRPPRFIRAIVMALGEQAPETQVGFAICLPPTRSPRPRSSFCAILTEQCWLPSTRPSPSPGSTGVFSGRSWPS